MILLVATTESLQIITAAALSTDWTSHYVDLTATAFTPGASQGNVSTATTTPIVAAPAASTSRQVKAITVRNRDSSAAQTVTIVKTVSGTDYHLTPATLLWPGESLSYVDGVGFKVFDANGNERINAMSNAPLTGCLMSPFFASANITSTKTITSGNSYATYLGRAPRALTSVSLRYRVTTAMATITWGEAAIATGPIVIGGSPVLSVKGYADISAVANSTGQKTTAISVSAGQSILAGDDLWAIFGNAATTAAVLRAASIVDDLGIVLTGVLSFRPSLNVGVGTAWTTDAAAVPTWVAGFV